MKLRFSPDPEVRRCLRQVEHFVAVDVLRFSPDPEVRRFFEASVWDLRSRAADLAVTPENNGGVISLDMNTFALHACSAPWTLTDAVT